MTHFMAFLLYECVNVNSSDYFLKSNKRITYCVYVFNSNTSVMMIIKNKYIRFNNGNASGKDEINLELINHGGNILHGRMHRLVEKVPKEWKVG